MRPSSCSTMPTSMRRGGGRPPAKTPNPGRTPGAPNRCRGGRAGLRGVTREMLVAGEETFGPVAPLFRFASEAEAVRMANDTEFGLAAYYYTRDLARSWRVAEALEYGIVGLNTGIISTEVAPFGGVKESGTGREGSKYGILDYTELKYLCVGIG